MHWNLKDHGDIIEQNSYNLICSKLPFYKIFWSKYVGNTGGKPVEIKDISKEADENRKKVAQCNYAILRNISVLKNLKKRNEIKKINKQNFIESETDYIITTHLFYNNIELINKVNFILEYSELKQLREKYEAFVSFRNFITHNLRPVVKIIDKQYHVPKNLEWFANNQIKTDDVWLWEEDIFKEIKYQKLPTFIDDRFNESISILNTLLKSEIIFFDNHFNGKSIIELPNNKINFTEYDAIASGSFNSSGTTFNSSGTT